ncbi:MAG: hypothetical protein SGILL_004407 [Bacillariaceae sp.]
MKFSTLSVLAIAATLAPEALAQGKKGGYYGGGKGGTGGKKGGFGGPFFIRSFLDGFNNNVQAAVAEGSDGPPPGPVGTADGDVFIVTNGDIEDFTGNFGPSLCIGSRCQAGVDAFADTGSDTLEIVYFRDCVETGGFSGGRRLVDDGDSHVYGPTTERLMEITCPDPTDGMRIVSQSCSTSSKTGMYTPSLDTCELSLGVDGVEEVLFLDVDFYGGDGYGGDGRALGMPSGGFNPDPGCVLEISFEVDCGPGIRSMIAPIPPCGDGPCEP